MLSHMNGDIEPVKQVEPIHKLTSYADMQSFCSDMEQGSLFVALLDPPDDHLPHWINQVLCATNDRIILITQVEDGSWTEKGAVVSAGDEGEIFFPGLGSHVVVEEGLSCPNGDLPIVVLSTLHTTALGIDLTMAGRSDTTVFSGTSLCRVDNELVFMTSSQARLFWSSVFMGSGLEHIEYDSILTR